MSILRGFRSSLKASFERMDKQIEDFEKEMSEQMKDVEKDIDQAFDEAEKAGADGIEKEKVVVAEMSDGTKVTTTTTIRRVTTVAKKP